MFASHSSNFANKRPGASAGGGQFKSFQPGQGPNGISVRMFNGSTPSYPYASAYFDVGYHNIDDLPQQRRFNTLPEPRPQNQNHFSFPDRSSKSLNTSRAQKSNFSIYPGVSKDMFIYEASNSEFSESTASLNPIPLPPSIMSSDSTDTLNPDSPIDPPPGHSSTFPSPSNDTFPPQPQSRLRNVLHDASIPRDQSVRSTQSIPMQTAQHEQASYTPFVTAEPESELDHISRVNTEINANARYFHGSNPTLSLPIEQRDIPTQIYRDIPPRSSPESYDTSRSGNAREPSPTFPATRPTSYHQPFNQYPLERRRSSYIPPPHQVELSISQSTTSTLDPNHPLLVAPSTEQVFEDLRSDSSGSNATVETPRRSPPQAYTRQRRDSGVVRQANGMSTSPVLMGINTEDPPSRSHGIDPYNTAQFHSSSPPRASIQGVQSFVAPQLSSSITMPLAPAQQVEVVSSILPPHVGAQVIQPAGEGPASIPRPRSRAQAVTITTVEGSSASERTLDDSPPPLHMLEPRQRNSSFITSGPAFGTSTGGRARRTSVSSIAPPVFNTLPTRLSPTSSLQVKSAPNMMVQAPPVIPAEARQSKTPSPPRTIAPPAAVPQPSIEDPYLRSRTPGPKRSHSDGDNPVYAGATQRSGTPFRTEFAPNVASGSTSLSQPPPPPPEPRRRHSDEQPSFKRALVLDTAATRTVRWNRNLICPSPILASQRRKGWYNRRGDQLWTNSGSYKSCPHGQEFPPDLDSYPEYGEGWMNEEGVRIDMMHRLIPKIPLRSALKQPRAANHA